ncbi:MAG: nuclear transport factor 2 family protein [Bacteroidota bacterium]
MKKAITLCLTTILIASTSFSQSNASKNAKLKAEIIALDKLAWKAWKDKNAEWFKTHTTEEFLSINSDGVSTKADVIKATPTDCDVKSFSLSDFKFIVLDANSVILTYIANQDATCNGKKVTPKVRASVAYVKRGGKWIEAFYIDTPVAE